MQKYAKAIVAICGAVCVAVAQQFPEYGPYAAVIAAFVTAIGVYLVPNLPAEDEWHH